MSKQDDRRIKKRLARYVARAPADCRLARFSAIKAKRAQRAAIKTRLAQYVARD